MTFDLLLYGQIFVLLAVVILEEVALHLQIYNSYFYQMSELWPMSPLLIIESTAFIFGLQLP